MPLLDLTDREGGFVAVPAGRYKATIMEAEERHTGGGGKMPEGTPMIAIQWRLDEALFDWPETVDDFNAEGELVPVDAPSLENRRVFSSHVIPPKEAVNYKMMNGMLFRMLEAIGYSKEELASGNFELDYEDMKSREALLTVTRETYTDPDTEEKVLQNRVKAIKAAGAAASSGIL